MRKRDTQELDREYFRRKMELSDFDCEELNQQIEEKYMVGRNLSTGTQVRIFDERQYMIDQGGWNDAGEVIIKGLKILPDGSYDCKPIAFELITDKLEQWRRWKGRKEYGKKRRDEELETASQQLANSKGYGYKDDSEIDPTR